MDIDPVSNLDSDLGDLVSVHKTGLWNYSRLLVISALLLMIGSLITFVGGGSLYEPDRLIVFLISVLLAFLPAFAAWYHSINEARFYENGFVYVTRRSKKTMLWSEVLYVYKWVFVMKRGLLSDEVTYRFSVRSEDGMIVRFSPRLDNVIDLGNSLFNVAKRRGLTVYSGIPSHYALRDPTETIDLNTWSEAQQS